MDITPLRIQSCLMSCINKVIFLCFCNKLKFHILSRDGKMLRLSPSIKILVLSKVDIALLCCQLSMYFVDVFNVSLQDRLTAPPSRLSGVCPRPSFPGAEEFFSELISAADSHTLNRHLSDAILTKITEVSIYVDLCLSEWVQWIRDVIKISLHASYQYSCMVWTAGRYQRWTHVRSMHSTSGVCVCCLASNGTNLSGMMNHDVQRLTRQPKLTAIIQSRWLTLFGHIMSMDDSADANRILLASPPADWRRQPGRPRITWLSTIQQYLKQHYLTLLKQQIWFRTTLCGGCRRMALRNLKSCMPETTTTVLTMFHRLCLQIIDWAFHEMWTTLQLFTFHETN